MIYLTSWDHILENSNDDPESYLGFFYCQCASLMEVGMLGLTSCPCAYTLASVQVVTCADPHLGVKSRAHFLTMPLSISRWMMMLKRGMSRDPLRTTRAVW